ncbi:unnamed protein product (macronuclear) [Paramecium tetraurelia]|uniref:Uncharacterized protein n=1 Tax=Paramecium tetraurelia TaxID=5888 RepID=A0BZI3_PARTE|nr:uncharacterized protein GSPATT00033803001 [Paramecium tetraurelia]CAK63950.1 unnamed protein product [Paramecium tetraurelia]|eukprot:XP_001431348.1 hypothetical protein (macronuclear) [Paramecium tetraurelia strain d4-2]
MINHQDSSSFEHNRLHQEMKQTAQFFNPQLGSLGQTIKYQQKQLQRVPFKNTKDQAFKINSEGKKNVLSQQVNQKRPSQPSQQESIAKSAKQFVQNQYITPVMHKYGSPPKLMKVPSIKPFSPPQPKSNSEQVIIAQNNSVASGIQRSANGRFFQTPKTTEKEFNISMADLQPIPKYNSTKAAEDYVKPEYPSYQKALLDSRQSHFNSEQMQKSNSTAFLPRIKPPIQKININQFIGYGSNGQQSQQETALRTSSSKQTITPVNEFINFNLPEEDISRKSRTAQHLRDNQDQQLQFKFGQKLKNIEQSDQIHQLPSLQSPQSSTKQQFTFQSTGGSGKPKNFLERTPQKKIISRLFSSKLDNNQVI